METPQWCVIMNFDTVTDFLSKNWFFLIIIAYLIWQLLRQRRRKTRFATMQAFEKVLQTEPPVVVEFFDDT